MSKPRPITCTVVQTSRQVTVVAQNATTVRGAVGFFTRQSKARFGSTRICAVK